MYLWKCSVTIYSLRTVVYHSGSFKICQLIQKLLVEHIWVFNFAAREHIWQYIFILELQHAFTIAMCLRNWILNHKNRSTKLGFWITLLVNKNKIFEPGKEIYQLIASKQFQNIVLNIRFEQKRKWCMLQQKEPRVPLKAVKHLSVIHKYCKSVRFSKSFSNCYSFVKVL